MFTKTCRAVTRWGIAVFGLAACASGPTAGPTTADTSVVQLAAVVGKEARPLTGSSQDYDALLAMIGDARVVLLGESTHGTHEFYRERARITQRLIQEKGFTAVAIEGDWPRAYRVNQYVRGAGSDPNADAALSNFTDFPVWMWRNTDVRDLVEWLRTYNRSARTPAGFYGLDLYSIRMSADAVVDYLTKLDPAAAQRARDRYRCFAGYEDGQEYAQAVATSLARSCEQQATEQLRDLEARNGQGADYFSAVQNARVVKNGEAYFRVSARGGASTWNLRDQHMAETLENLVKYLDSTGQPGKVVVWEHNSHVGDARATQMGEEGELNIGQLARQRWGKDAVLVGFTTYAGTVMAASQWGGNPEVKRVRPGLPGSYESVFHEVEAPNFLLLLRSGDAAEGLRRARLERAIGVIYLPQSERASHYFNARLSDQFDAVIHFDESRAVDPLGRPR